MHKQHQQVNFTGKCDDAAARSG